MIGFAFCGSFCTHARCLNVLEILAKQYEIQPIMSETVYNTDTRFGTAKELCTRVEELCQKPIIHTIVQAEPLGPKTPLDLLIIAPCTGNTLSKMANGITDTAVTMAAKAHLRSDRPLLIALATNDALSANLGNIATMSNRKHVTMVPMKKDDPVHKPYSLIADFEKIPSIVPQLLG